MYGSEAYDPLLGGIVVFGGINNASRAYITPAFNDTWLYANGTWTNLTGEFTTAPPARWAASFTWDAHDGYMVLFGGRTGGTSTVLPRFINDTWGLGSAGWFRVSTTSAPSSRGFAPFAYDPDISSTLLFSGGDIDFSNGTIAALHDTWTFAAGVWTNITTSAGTGAGQASSMAYDPAAPGVIATGIMRPDSICTPLNQTWVFSGGVWTKLLNASSPPPGGNLVYDNLTGQLLYTGGCVPPTHSPVVLTWEYSNGTWNNITANLSAVPGAICCSTLAYDPVQKVALLFGGNRVHPSAKAGYVNWAYAYPVEPLSSTLHANRPAGAVPFSAKLTSDPIGGVGPYSYNWTFGDGTLPVSGRNVSHVYSSVGTYQANYTVTDSQGRSWNGTLSLVAGPAYSLTASALPLTGEAPLAVTVNASAAGGFTPYSYVWNFGDGAVALGANGSHTYLSGGTFVAQVNATDAAADTILYNATITVISPVTASIVRTPSVGVAPLPVTFTATPSGGVSPYTLTWDFGDGSPAAAGTTASHTYGAAGSYVAVLNITDALGRTALLPSNVTVVAALAAQAAAGPTAGVVPVAVNFNGTAHGGLPPYTYAWTFGDGATSSSASASHTYSRAGNFTATLTVADDLNESASATVTIQVVEPLAVAGPAPLVGVAPASLSFSPQVTGGVGPYSFDWTFGDGGTATTGPASHTYTSAGHFNATVTVRDGLGESAVNVTAVTIVYPLSASLTSNLSSLSVGESVTITATVSDGYGPFTYAWSGLPTGCTADASTPDFSCAPTAAGTFTVSVRVSDNLGESANASTSITVSSPPSTGGSNTGLTTPQLELLAAIVIVVAVIAVLAFLLLRRPPTRPAPAEASSETPPEDASDASPR